MSRLRMTCLPVLVAFMMVGTAVQAGDMPTGGAPAAASPPVAVKAAAWDISLVPDHEPGRPFVIEGRVIGLPDSLPIRDAVLYAYQTDARGHYSMDGVGQPRLSGTLHTNVGGGFRIRTILPGKYEGSPHLHYRLSGPGIKTQSATLSLFRDRGAGYDTTYAQLPWLLEKSTNTSLSVEPDTEGGFTGYWILRVSH